MSDFNSVKSLLESGKIKGRQKVQNNFFDVGMRGYYENPYTEVLSYLIGYRSQYANKKEFLKLFLKSLPDLPDDVVDTFSIELNIDTQYATNAKNFIDMIFFNGKYVLVFENKIQHWLANPLADYEDDIKKRFPHLIPYFFVLSKHPIDTPANWKNVTISKTFSYIKNSLKISFSEKWDYFVDDFLTHYMPSNDTKMTEEEFDFYSKNFSTVFTANNNVNDFIEAVVDRVKSKLPEPLADIKFITNFGDKVTRAVRLYPNKSSDNVVLVFKSGNKVSINLYYYKEPRQHLENILKTVGKESYTNWTEGSVSCFKRHSNQEFINVEEAINECCTQIVRMKQYGS